MLEFGAYENGARGQSCTDTGDALDVVPLLVGLHERTSPAGLFHRLMPRVSEVA
jgi:hypothetical protein